MIWNEKDHPRDDLGRFTDGNAGGKIGSILPGSGEPISHTFNDTVKLPDEDIPRSVGAKWANHDIKMPDGGIASFVEGSKLQNKEIFAGKGCVRKIDDINRLLHDYPGTIESEWMKVKAVAEIVTKYGEYLKAEIHWYEESHVGKVEFKFKSEI